MNCLFTVKHHTPSNRYIKIILQTCRLFPDLLFIKIYYYVKITSKISKGLIF